MKIVAHWAIVAGVLSFSTLFAQQSDETQKPQREVVEFAERYDRQFLKRDPKLGSTVPDLKAWDADGKPFELRSTRGKHTVIVFGCLT